MVNEQGEHHGDHHHGGHGGRGTRRHEIMQDAVRQPFETLPLQQAFIRTAKRHRQMIHARLSVREVFPGQPSLLSALAEQDGQPQRLLAERMQVTPATINVMIGRMEKAGLLRRVPDETDQRVSRVYLTGKGREVHAFIAAEMSGIEAAAFDGFTEEEQETFRGMLKRMYDNLNRTGDGQ